MWMTACTPPPTNFWQFRHEAIFMNVRTIPLVAQVQPFIRFSNVIHRKDVVDARFVQCPNHAAANEAGSAGDDDCHFLSPFYAYFQP